MNETYIGVFSKEIMTMTLHTVEATKKNVDNETPEEYFGTLTPRMKRLRELMLSRPLMQKEQF